MSNENVTKMVSMLNTGTTISPLFAATSALSSITNDKLREKLVILMGIGAAVYFNYDKIKDSYNWIISREKKVALGDKFMTRVIKVSDNKRVDLYNNVESSWLYYMYKHAGCQFGEYLDYLNIYIADKFVCRLYIQMKKIVKIDDTYSYHFIKKNGELYMSLITNKDENSLSFPTYRNEIKKSISMVQKTYIFEYKKNKWTTEVISDNYTSFDNIHFASKNKFLTYYDRFVNNPDFYKQKGDPRVFTCLLYGVPGCGKTSIVRAMLNYDLKYTGKRTHIKKITFDKTFTFDKLKKLIYETNINNIHVPMDQQLILFEDFDVSPISNIFMKRDKKEVKDEVSDLDKQFNNIIAGLKNDEVDKSADICLSDVLNIMDGVNSRTLQRMVFTTNVRKPEEIYDEAFLRPGRITTKIYMEESTLEDVQNIIRMYFKDANIMQYKELHKKFTASRIKEFVNSHTDVASLIEDMLSS